MEKDELIITAEQAQLELTAEEETRLRTAVSEMIEYFSLMNKVDVNDLPPTTHALVRENALRNDNAVNNYNPVDLVNRAPEHENNFIVIPNVL